MDGLTRMNTAQLLQVDTPLLRIDLLWAIGICFGILLVGVFIGLLIGWILTGRDLLRARIEVERLRTVADTRLSIADVPAILTSLTRQLDSLRARLGSVERQTAEAQEKR